MEVNENNQNSNLKLKSLLDDKEKEKYYNNNDRDKETVHLVQENSLMKNKKILYFLFLSIALLIIIITEALTRQVVFNWSLTFEKNLQKNKSDFLIGFFKVISDIGNAMFYIPVKF
jgi:hypothetical protein